eukprot:SM000105S13857  [mRNA]  locus=s105:164962:167580:+ [translate_table: standard]
MDSPQPTEEEEEEEEALLLAEDLAAPEVCKRMEATVMSFLEHLTHAHHPIIPSLRLLCRWPHRASKKPRHDHSIGFVQKVTCPHRIKAYVRAWKVLEICHQLLSDGRKASQREIYYRLVADIPRLVDSQRDSNRAISGVHAAATSLAPRCLKSLRVIAVECDVVAGHSCQVLCQILSDLTGCMRCSAMLCFIMMCRRRSSVALYKTEPWDSDICKRSSHGKAYCYGGQREAHKDVQQKLKQACSPFSAAQAVTGSSVDCSKLGTSGMAISGDVRELEGLRFSSEARYILVIEKDAVFQHLAQDALFMSIPNIMITAKGFPDLATRVFLFQLHKAFPHLPIMALVDWNPAGIHIICNYAIGGSKGNLESPRYGGKLCSIFWYSSTLLWHHLAYILKYDTFVSHCHTVTDASPSSAACPVRWLGLRSQDVKLLLDDSLKPFTARDWRMIENLHSSCALQAYPQYLCELQRMEALGKRADIEALYRDDYHLLGRHVAQKVLRADCL